MVNRRPFAAAMEVVSRNVLTALVDRELVVESVPRGVPALLARMMDELDAVATLAEFRDVLEAQLKHAVPGGTANCDSCPTTPPKSATAPQFESPFKLPDRRPLASREQSDRSDVATAPMDMQRLASEDEPHPPHPLAQNASHLSRFASRVYDLAVGARRLVFTPLLAAPGFLGAGVGSKPGTPGPFGSQTLAPGAPLDAAVEQLAALVWMRRFALLLLRELADVHREIRTLRAYWEWAQLAPLQHTLHVFWSSPRRFLVGYVGDREPLIPKRRAAISATLSRLAIAESRVVARIGQVYNALTAAVGAVDALGAAIDQKCFDRCEEFAPHPEGSAGPATPAAFAHPAESPARTPPRGVIAPEETRRGARAEGTPEPAPLGSAFGDARPAHGSADTASSLELDDALVAIVERGLHAFASSFRDDSNEASGAVAPSDACGGFGAAANPLARGASGVVHDASVDDGCRLPHGDSCASLHTDPLHMRLLRVASRTLRWLRAMRRGVLEREALPRGRHWRRGAVAAAALLPLMSLSRSGSLTFAFFRALAVGATERLLDFAEAYGTTPIAGVWASLTQRRSPSEARRESLAAEVRSLARMVVEYHRHTQRGATEAELLDVHRAVVERDDLGVIYRDYEWGIQRPIRSFLFGSLGRVMLIQLQKQKVDVNRVLVSSDEVLEQNDLNFRVMAMAPGVVVCLGVVYWGLLRKRARRRPVHERLRICWRTLMRVVQNAEADGSTSGGGGDGGSATGGGFGAAAAVGASSARSGIAVAAATVRHVDQGYILLNVQEMRELAALLRLEDGHAQTRAMFEEDLDDIECPLATKAQRLAVLQRMFSTHGFLHPPLSGQLELGA